MVVPKLKFFFIILKVEFTILVMVSITNSFSSFEGHNIIVATLACCYMCSAAFPVV
jgi:hypothetical protein